MIKDLDLVTMVSRWYLLEQLTPLYENDNGKVNWDVLAYAENLDVRNNRIDARVINNQKKGVPTYWR